MKALGHWVHAKGLVPVCWCAWISMRSMDPKVMLHAWQDRQAGCAVEAVGPVHTSHWGLAAAQVQ
jgi:hypothetical protein